MYRVADPPSGSGTSATVQNDVELFGNQQLPPLHNASVNVRYLPSTNANPDLLRFFAEMLTGYSWIFSADSALRISTARISLC